MKIEISKAKAFEIDPTKNYLVSFESEVAMSREEAVKIKEKLIEVFTEIGAKVHVAILVKGKIVITEVRDKK